MERPDGKSQFHPRADPCHKMELMQEIWRLKKEFWTFDEIGEELGISHKTAWKYFHEYELFLVPPNVEQERLMHIQQLQAKLSQANKLLERAGDVETQLKVLAEVRAWMKQYARFLGMEADRGITVRNVTTTEADENIRELLEQFGDFHEEEERAAKKERDYRRGRFKQ